MPYSTYANYENGNREPDFSTMQKIAHALGVTVLDLYDDGNIEATIDRLDDILESDYDKKRCLELIALNCFKRMFSEEIDIFDHSSLSIEEEEFSGDILVFVNNEIEYRLKNDHFYDLMNDVYEYFQFKISK